MEVAGGEGGATQRVALDGARLALMDSLEVRVKVVDDA